MRDPLPVSIPRASRWIGIATLVITLAAACGGATTAGDAGRTPGASPTTQDPVIETVGTPGPTATASQVPEPTAPAPAVTGTVDWSDPDTIADLGDGWTVAACLGEAPLLCVERNGEPIGVIESFRTPTDGFDFHDADAPAIDNLEMLATDFIEALTADRAAGCPPGYVLDPLAPVEMTIAGLAGLHYGYVGTNGDGTASELNLQYATIADGDLVLVTAIAYDEGGCPGRDDLSGFDSRTLEQFRPRLEALLPHIPLPPTRA